MGGEGKARELAPGSEMDEALLRRCAVGDTAAFRELFDRYESLLTRFFAHALGSREDAEEATIDTFLKLWRSASSYREEAAVRTWLYRIATRTAIDALRRRRRQPIVDAAVAVASDREPCLGGGPELADPEALVLAGYQQERDRQALRRALAHLAPSQRTLVVLFYFEGHSYAQIGEITGSSLTRVRRLLYRARQRLRAHFVRLRDPDEDLEMLADSPADSALETGRLLAL